MLKGLPSYKTIWALLLAGQMVARVAGAANAETAAAPAADATPRAAYNHGTGLLQAGKLTEAEQLLQNSVAAQTDSLQALALYNLGCARVALGIELLKKSQDPTGQSDQGHVTTLTAQAEDASQRIDDAIASQNEQKMITAYLRGGGIKREINEATKAVRQALADKKDILAKWQRADGDFRSAEELDRADKDSTFNAQATEKAIAALIDKLNKLQGATLKMQAVGKQLGEKLKKLKGMMEMPNMPPGAPGDDVEQDPGGLKPDEQEGAGKTGQEMKISPEEAEQLLAGFKLGGEHRLPLGNENSAKPKDRKGKDW